MKKIAYLIVVLFSLSFVSMASAIDLNTAKSKGLVGELPTGYLGVVKSSSEVNKLVSNINQKRKATYKKIATKNKTDLSNIEMLAGKKAIQKTPKGQYIKESGRWKKK